MMVSAEEAFRAYEAVRHRLPAAQDRPVSFQRAQTLAEVADRFDVFLLDAFGVLNIGETAIPGTRDRIASLREAGKRVIVVSNAASVPLSALVEKYRRLGYDFAPDEVVTSRATLAASISGMDPLLWGVMAGAGTPLDDLGKLRTLVLEDDPGQYRAVGGFLLIGSGAWSDARQALLEDALIAQPRPVLVANPDIVAPRENGLSAEPGHFAHRLADRTGVDPVFFGKPFENIFDLAFSRVGKVDRARWLMVGDSLHTDILGAQAAGIASALVTGYGFFSGGDAEAAIERTGIIPDFVLSRP